MINNLTAKYTKLTSGGYMRQLIEWSEVITEGSDLPAKTLERWVKQLRDEAKIEYLGSKKTSGYFIK